MEEIKDKIGMCQSCHRPAPLRPYGKAKVMLCADCMIELHDLANRGYEPDRPPIHPAYHYRAVAV